MLECWSLWCISLCSNLDILLFGCLGLAALPSCLVHHKVNILLKVAFGKRLALLLLYE